ncbi:MAG: winged helix-turn-helix domain-containing protein [Chthoniobacteraceae bacterium]
MPNRSRPPTPPANATGPNPDTIFATLGDPVRRRILMSLTDGAPRTAKQLSIAVARRISATIKHLAVLREAGLIVSQPDPKDGHHQHYVLSVGIPVTRTERGLEMDFDCCVVRLRP